MSTKIALALVAAFVAFASPAFAGESYFNCGPTQYDSSGAAVAHTCR